MGLERLTWLLQEESRLPVPHLCLSFALSAQLPISISDLACSSQDSGIYQAAVSAFGILIDNEEDLLGDEVFAKSLIQLTASSSRTLASSESEVSVAIVELLFGVASKIRLQPEILPAWFTPGNAPKGLGKGQEHGVAMNREAGVGSTDHQDFPLFYLLLDYVHYEAPVGDFARTGLLYIIECASKFPPLEVWIVESDLAPLMASALGALYSQLSR